MLNLYKYHTEPDSLMQYTIVFKYTDEMVRKIMQRYLSELQGGKYSNVMEAFGIHKFDCRATEDACGIYPLGLDKRGLAVRVCIYEGRSLEDFALDCLLVFDHQRSIAYTEELSKLDPVEQTYQLFVKALGHLADKQLASEGN
jgi:hypothetical protein